MTMIRVGQGYDVHRLTGGRPLILGGITVPFDCGMDGHSDADVLTHAIMDALLGAAALGDIGKLFPDTDEQYRGADSIGLLRDVREHLYVYGWRTVNVDATVVAQAPKLSPFIDGMRHRLAEALEISVEAISVKATTEEHLGFTGDGSGIAAQAIALIEKME